MMGGLAAMAAPNVLQEGMLVASPHYDPLRFQWIGRMDRLAQTAIVSGRCKARTLADAKSIPLVAGVLALPPAAVQQSRAYCEKLIATAK